VVLLIGGSNVTIGAGGRPLNRLLDEALNAGGAGVWEVRTAPATPGRSMKERAIAAVREHQPDIAVLAIPAAQFTYEFVVNRLRRRWPWVYQPALKFTQWLKAASGGAGEDSAGARALIYRVPEEIALRLIGGEPYVPVERAIENATETIEAFVRLEEMPFIVRQPVGGMRATRARARRYEERLTRFRSEIEAVCARHRVPCVDVAARMRESAMRAGFGADGIHLNEATRRFEAELLSAAILDAAAPRASREQTTTRVRP
jgi:hypothetical protein